MNTPTVPTLAPDALKNVVCKVCAGTFDLSATGVFPEHFFNFRALRKPCKASGQRFAHVNEPPGKKTAKAPKKQNQPQARPPKEAPTQNLPVLRLTSNGKAECPACYRLLTPSTRNTLPVHKINGESCRMSNRAFEFVTRKGKTAKHPSATVQHYTQKYKVRSPEEIRKENKRQGGTSNRKRQQERERRRQQRRSDSYALDCYDSWGQDDQSVDQGQSVRTYRGGLPGQGRRR